ncbi:MAG: hypothetical protein AB3N23_18340, partial [Paracoccaceae bacterium]
MTRSRIISWPIAQKLVFALAILTLAFAAQMVRADVAPFVGEYTGSAEMERADGTTRQRDMSVEITEGRKGSFSVRWTTITYKSKGRTTEKSYDVEFVPSDREGVYAAAQKKNVFGHEVQLDPMKGEPYVWARIMGDTLTVYSLFVADDGGYEIPQVDRTLGGGGFQLEFNRLRNGVQQGAVSAFLDK